MLSMETLETLWELKKIGWINLNVVWKVYIVKTVQFTRAERKLND